MRPMSASRRLETVVFCALVLVHLLPVWLFRYLPTQDGPLHLANAVLLKDYGRPSTRYHEFFELRLEPLPNWTTHLLLVGLLHLVPPLLAEKLLASAYVVGFAWSFRYFLGAFGGHCRALAPVGLLFLFNRCFLLGFSNYCLSLIALWLVLGYCLRRRTTFGVGNAVVLMSFLWLAYFTHLLGYLFAAAGAAWVIVTAPGRRLPRLACLAAALLPTGGLAACVLFQPGVLGVREAARTDGGLLRARFREGPAVLWNDLQGLDAQLFGAYEPSWLPLGILVLLFFEALLLTALIAERGRDETTEPVPPRWPVAVFGLATVGLYLVLPDALSTAVGLLKPRLALLPPLLALACLRLPEAPIARRLLTAALLLLLGLNLMLVLRHFHAANRKLAEYTAGIAAAGRQRVLFVVQDSRKAPLADYLEHAADYYCLTTGNVNLDNFQATLQHFPVRFRPGVQRGRGNLLSYPGREAVDVVLVWDSPAPPLPPDTWEERYRRGRLSVLVKRQAPRGALSFPELHQEKAAATRQEPEGVRLGINDVGTVGHREGQGIAAADVREVSGVERQRQAPRQDRLVPAHGPAQRIPAVPLEASLNVQGIDAASQGAAADLPAGGVPGQPVVHQTDGADSDNSQHAEAGLPARNDTRKGGQCQRSRHQYDQVAVEQRRCDQQEQQVDRREAGQQTGGHPGASGADETVQQCGAPDAARQRQQQASPLVQQERTVAGHHGVAELERPPGSQQVAEVGVTVCGRMTVPEVGNQGSRRQQELKGKHEHRPRTRPRLEGKHRKSGQAQGMNDHQGQEQYLSRGGNLRIQRYGVRAGAKPGVQHHAGSDRQQHGQDPRRVPAPAGLTPGEQGRRQRGRRRILPREGRQQGHPGGDHQGRSSAAAQRPGVQGQGDQCEGQGRHIRHESPARQEHQRIQGQDSHCERGL